MRFGFFSSILMIAAATKTKTAMAIGVEEPETDEDLKWFAQLMGLGDDFNEEKLMELAQISIENEFEGGDEDFGDLQLAEVDNEDFEDDDDFD